MSEPLELPKPKPQMTKSRERLEGTTDEARLLASVGERLKPDSASLQYVGSFASHIYYNALANEYLFFGQTTDLAKVPDNIANEAIKELARAIMIKYGHKPPSKIGERQDI